MSDENRRGGNNPNRNNRGSNRGGRGPRRGHNRGGRGRQQRPLLTSATMGMGAALVALAIVSSSMEGSQPQSFLAISVYGFAASALVSYFAQRSKSNWLERVSDLGFFVGLIFSVMSAFLIGGSF